MSDRRIRGETEEGQRAAEGPSGRAAHVPVEGRELGLLPGSWGGHLPWGGSQPGLDAPLVFALKRRQVFHFQRTPVWQVRGARRGRRPEGAPTTRTTARAL